jgi:hypothetical protein
MINAMINNPRKIWTNISFVDSSEIIVSFLEIVAFSVSSKFSVVIELTSSLNEFTKCV